MAFRFGFNRNVVSRHVIVKILEYMIYPKFTESFFAYFYDWEVSSYYAIGIYCSLTSSIL